MMKMVEVAWTALGDDGIIASIVGGVIVLILVYIFRRHVSSFAKYVSWYFSTALQLQWNISTARVTHFNRERADYRSLFPWNRGRQGITSYIKSAKESVTIVSISLVTGVSFEEFKSAIVSMINDHDLNVRISLLNPEKTELMSSMASVLDLSAEDLQASIRGNLFKLNKIRDQIIPEKGNKYDLRVHNAIPFASAIMIDENCSNGVIQLEMKPFGFELNCSIGVTLRRGGRHILCDRLIKSYNMLIDQQSIEFK